MAEPQQACDVTIRRWQSGTLQPPTADIVASEEPLEIRVRGQAIAITMRTPGHDEELATGFLLSENILHNRSDVTEIAHCREGNAVEHDNILNVFLAPSVNVDLEQLTRHVFASSSCGLCGKASIESVKQHFPSIESQITISGKLISSLPDILREAQPTFDKTGGLHAAGIFSLEGKLLVSREDIGRHNAVDKAIGHLFLAGANLEKTILMVSGRVSFEILQKALAARIPIIAAVSAPSSLAVEFAQQNNQILAGFVRGKTLNIYSGADRVT